MAQPRGISGNQGRVVVGGSTIAEVLGFDATIDFGIKPYVAQSGVSGGVGYQKTVLGNQKMTGTIRGLLDPSYPAGSVFANGAIVQLILYSQYPNAYVSCQARISNRTLAADINSGDPEPFSASFESDGLITQTSM